MFYAYLHPEPKRGKKSSHVAGELSYQRISVATISRGADDPTHFLIIAAVVLNHFCAHHSVEQLADSHRRFFRQQLLCRFQ
jgi:hypothetical protein